MRIQFTLLLISVYILYIYIFKEAAGKILSIQWSLKCYKYQEEYMNQTILSKVSHNTAPLCVPAKLSEYGDEVRQ